MADTPPPMRFFVYECHNQPCATTHTGVLLELRARIEHPFPLVECLLCGGLMTFCGSELADKNGYRVRGTQEAESNG